MKSKFTMAIKIMSTIALTILLLSCLWLAYLTGYYIPLSVCWVMILFYLLVAGICGLGMAVVWMPEECEWKDMHEWTWYENCEIEDAKEVFAVWIMGCSMAKYDKPIKEGLPEICPHCGRKIKVVE